MKFSIVTPSWNQGLFIRHTIDSVITQHGDFEIDYRVVDGGSEDDTLDILKDYSDLLRHNPRIHFSWTSGKDSGQANAINRGLCIADGDIFAFINSDDCYEPGAFETVSRQFMKNPNRLWLTGYNRIVDGNGQVIQKLVTLYKNFWLNRYCHAILLVLNCVSQPSTFFRKEAFRKWGPFDESLHLCMDYQFWLRLSRISRPIVVRQFLSSFRIHSTSKGMQSFHAQFDEELSVARSFTRNGLILLLHWMHSGLVKTVYRVIK